MLRLLSIPAIVAAVYLWPSAEEPVAPPEENTSTSITNTLLTKAQSAVGLKIDSLPSTGCSDSAIPPEKVSKLLDVIPSPQKEALAAVLESSAVVWTVQLYSGSDGIGLCIPEKDKMVAFPGLSTDIVEKIKDAVSDSGAMFK